MQPNVQPGGLELGLLGIGALLVLAAVVCSVIVGVRMIKENQSALGIISIILTFCTGIGFFITLIFGWMKASEWNIKGLMMGYTFAFLVGYGLVFAGYGVMGARIANDPQFRDQMQQMQQELEGLDNIDIQVDENPQ